jgi:hypothetical protein
MCSLFPWQHRISYLFSKKLLEILAIGILTLTQKNLGKFFIFFTEIPKYAGFSKSIGHFLSKFQHFNSLLYGLIQVLSVLSNVIIIQNRNKIWFNGKMPQRHPKSMMTVLFEYSKFDAIGH